jgi:hypothetical protein
MSSIQCEAITTTGSRCKRNAEYNSKYCWQHKNLNISKIQNIEFLLDYHNINNLYDKYKKELKLEDQKLPFEYKYDFIFYGLIFNPFELSTYKINTIQELFTLYFKLSLIEYANINLFPELIDILPLLKKYRSYKYSNKCSNTEIYVRSNYKYVDTTDFKVKDFENLCEFYDIPFPEIDVLFFLNRDDVGTLTSLISILFFEKWNIKKIYSDGIEVKKNELSLMKKYIDLFQDFEKIYGLNRPIFKPIQKFTVSNFEKLIDNIPFLDEKGARKWNKDNKQYTADNLFIFIYAYNQLSDYQNYSYDRINEGCLSYGSHSYGKIYNKTKFIIRSLSFAFPTISEFWVHRFVKIYVSKLYNLLNLPIYDEKNNYEDCILTAESLFSTSLNYEPYKDFIDEGSGNYIIYSLFVPIGTKCIPLFSYTHEYELIFPPGMKYVLYKKDIYPNNLIFYTGIIVN